MFRWKEWCRPVVVSYWVQWGLNPETGFSVCGVFRLYNLVTKKAGSGDLELSLPLGTGAEEFPLNTQLWVSYSFYAANGDLSVVLFSSCVFPVCSDVGAVLPISVGSLVSLLSFACSLWGHLPRSHRFTPLHSFCTQISASSWLWLMLWAVKTEFPKVTSAWNDAFGTPFIWCYYVIKRMLWKKKNA